MNISRFFRKLSGQSRSSRRSRRRGRSSGKGLPIPNPFASQTFQIDDPQGFFLILNWLGYVLLFVSAIDYFLIFYPPQLTNPNWELQTFIAMVNNAWFLLLAIVLVFLPTRRNIRQLELSFMKLLRWVMLLAGVLFILLIPLGITNTQRINQDANQQLVRQQQIRQEQLDRIEEAVENENLPLFQRQRLGQAIGLERSESSEEAILERVQTLEEQLNQEVAAAKRDRFQNLMRRMVRTNIGGLLIGVLLIRFWWQTRWIKSIGKSSFMDSP